MKPTDNIDINEINKFAKLASRWWDPTSEFKPLHDINPLRLDYIDNITPLAGKKVLDVGCGGGILSESMVTRGATVMGIDAGDAPISVAKLHALETQTQIDYQQITAEHLSETHHQQFDVVTCMEMLEHVPDPSSVIQACARMVKPNGHVFFSTLNRNLKSYCFAIIGAEYLLKMLPKGTHEYRNFIKPSELAKWARESALTVNEIKGMTYNPFISRYQLNSDTDVNYLIHCTLPC